MALKDTWVDKTRDDYNNEQIPNELAAAIIELEKRGADESENELPVKNGDGDSSLLIGDIENNKALSGASIAAGSGNIAGRKAYYIKSIDTTNGKICLSETQVTPVFSDADNTDYSFLTPAYSEGDEFSIIAGGRHYILCGTIQSIDNNVISYDSVIVFDGNETITRIDFDGVSTYRFKVEKEGITSDSVLNKTRLDYDGISGYFHITEVGDGYIIVSSIDSYDRGIREAMVQNNLKATGNASLPFTEFPSIVNPIADDYTFCVPAKPHVGIVTLGEYAFSVGTDNIAAGYASFTTGGSNLAAGDFSAVTGRFNTGGYAALVSGFKNTAKGNGSFASGYYNVQSGDSGFVTGNRNTSHGPYSHTEGQGNTSNGNDNHVEGRNNTVSGALNTVGGGENNVDGSLHDVSGQYNKVTGYRNTVRGENNIASGSYQFVMGRYNADDANKTMIVGSGTSENNRKNIFTLDKNGNAFFMGDIVSPSVSRVTDTYLYTFDNYRAIENFVSRYQHLQLLCQNRTLYMESFGADPYVMHHFSLPADGKKYPIIQLMYRVLVKPASPMAKIYYTTSEYPSVSEDRKIQFNMDVSGEWATFTSDMSLVSNWNNITSLRFDMPNTSQDGVTVQIKYIGLFHDSSEAESFEV